MKKIIGSLLTSIMLLASLVGCGGSSSSSVEVSADLPEDVQAIQKRGVLKVGVKNNVEGFGLQDPLSGQYTGLEIDLAEKIADYLGVDIECTTVTAATRTELLDSGAIDCVIATFTITDERRQNWDFTTAYYTDAVTVLVENASGLTKLADFNNGVIGVSSGSTSARAMVAAMVEQGLIDSANFDFATFDPSTWKEVVSFRQYDDYPAISTALSAGEVAAFCVDKSILSIYNTDSRSFIEDKFAPQEYGIATKKGTGFAALCEELVTTWIADGTIEQLIASNGISE